MYTIFYNDSYIYDPYENQECVTDVKLTANVNAAAYLDFTISPKHPLYNIVEERSGIVKVYYDDEKLFEGVVDSIEMDMYGYKSISCVSALDYLGDTCTRSYHTGPVEPTDKSKGVKAPESIDQFFQWLIDQHNQHVQNSNKTFVVGVNQGSSFSESNIIDVESTSHESTADAITNNLIDRYGGYLTLTYEGEQRVLNLYSDVHEMNAQIMDFGVNITDFTKTTTTEDQYTAVYPIGGTPENKNENDKNTYPPIDISSLPDGTTEQDADIVKSGDVIFSRSAVARYGYKEYYYSENNILDATNLLKAAIIALRKSMSPKVSIDVKAIDCALFMKGYHHLAVGEAVRVRSNPHKVDEYLMVSSIDLDLQNPENTEYTLGTSYDTLTGQQSSYLRSLNSTINSAVDSVGALDKASKETAKTAQEAKANSIVAKDTANTAKDTADTAKNTADKAQTTAIAANTAAGNAQSTANTAVSNAATAKNAADAAQSSANKAQGDVDKLKIDIPETYATKSSLTQTAESITANVESVKATANSAVTAASNAQQTADGISANLTKNYQTKSQADTIYATKASLKATSDSISAEVTKAQGTADGAVTAASKAQQTADAVTLNLSKNYQTKAQNDALYATQTSLKATSDSLSANITANANTAQSAVDKATSLEANLNGFKTTVSQTYTTKNDVGIGNLIKNGDFSDGMTNWTTMGGTSKIVDGTYGKQFVFTQTETNTNGNNRIYNDTHSHINGQSYEVSFYAKADKSSKWHFGPTGSSKAASTTLDTTLKQYAMQYQADNTTVFSVWTDNPTATIHLERVKLSVASGYYATNSSLTQTANSIKAEVSETYTTKNDFNNLTIGGTNRIILTGVKSGRISIDGNVVVNGGEPDHCITIPVSAEPNTKYTISGSIPTPSNSYVSVAFYDENGQFISRPTGAYTVTEAPWKNTFTSPANAVTVRSSFPVIFKGKIKLEKGDKPTDWSPAPEDLQPAGDYSTKSYVDQTAESVALGVVQNYKGADGSGLATKSDITVAKNSITTTVSNTYQTKADMSNYATQSQLTQTNNKVTIAFQNSQSVGGRNLLLKTGVPTVVTGSEGPNQPVAVYELAAGSLKNLPVGMYHLQFKIKSDTAGGTAYPQWNGDPWRMGDPINIGTEEQTYSTDYYISNNNYPNAKKIQVRLDNAKGNVTIRDMKLERGNSMTPWTAAPEDTMNDLTSAVQKQAADIAGKVSNDDYTGYVDATNKNLNDIQSSQQQLSDSISNEIALRESYIQFGQDESNPYMDMGSSSSPNKMRLTNTKLSFTSNNTEVASVSNDKMRISNAEVLQTFRIGNFVWQPRSDGHMALKYSPEV